MSYTAAIKEAFANARSDVAIIDTLEIKHASIPEGLWLVRDFDDLEAELENGGGTQLFKAAGFQIQLPRKDEKGIQDLNIAIDNTNLEVSDFVTTAMEFQNEPITVTYRPYMSTDLSAPQLDPPLILYLDNIQITHENVTATATFADILNKQFLSQLYTKLRFPAL